jgi:hypothetical protein
MAVKRRSRERGEGAADRGQRGEAAEAVTEAMTEQQTIRAHSSEIRDKFEQWLTREQGSGARLVILEGLMKSGKSKLTKEPLVLGHPIRAIELDHFLRRPVNPDTAYMDAIDIEAATLAIKNAMATASLVIAEGPMAWPVTQRVRKGLTASAIRRVYLKRMAPRNPDDWEDLEFAQLEDKSRGEFFLSIDRYHVRTEPWVTADLILERTGRDEIC